MAIDAQKVGDTNLNREGSDIQSDANQNAFSEVLNEMDDSKKTSTDSFTNESSDNYMQQQGFPSVAGCTS